ncbi:MAG: glycosyltransferase family 2 protein [Pseudomonadota bacterium]|nr:glycosyltransferase family 2 protein [Pseudomonadota bacterium]
MIDPADHCFVVPAYGESPHLSHCLTSLAGQTTRTRTLIATSTPNQYIGRIAEDHGVAVHVNPHRGGIGSDWNFALQSARAPWVTLAHQDDLYLPDFTRRTLEALANHPEAVLAFTGYDELQGNTVRPPSMLIRIKQALLELGFLGGSRASSSLSKTNALRFGCAICCPSVTVNLDATGLSFRTDLKVDLDWAAWLELARKPGDFVYVRGALMQHRLHAQSETSAAIDDGHRLAEDELLLRSLWPEPIARAITASYRIAYRSNQVPNEP